MPQTTSLVAFSVKHKNGQESFGVFEMATAKGGKKPFYY